MKFEDLLNIVGDEAIFESGLLLAGKINPRDVRRQLSLWVAAGKLYQLRRGVYALAPPYQKTVPHPFLVANQMVRGSYVSLQSALAYYNLIPEYVPVTLSVTTRRPGHWETHMGSFDFRHITKQLFSGYRRAEIVSNQDAFLALPEKALLDLVHLIPGGDTAAFLTELRLQNLEQLDLELLHQLAIRPKLQRAADWIANKTDMERQA